MTAPRDGQFATHEFTSEGAAATEHAATALGRLLRGGEIIALRGELGAGKTCFVRGLAAGLGVDPEEIASPTFVIAVEHRGTRLGLSHLDAYRLSSAEDLESIGFEEMLRQPSRVMAVEWPERLGSAFPPPTVDVQLHHTGPTSRRIRLRGEAALVLAWSRVVTHAPQAPHEPEAT